MIKQQLCYDKLIAKHYNNDFNDFVNFLSHEELKAVNNTLQKQLNKQIKTLTDETEHINTIINNRLNTLHIVDGLYKLHFCKSITTLNNKIYKLIELYKTIETTEELICLTTTDKHAHNQARLNNLITFYKPIIKTIEHYIYLLEFKIYIPNNSYYNIAHLLAYIFSNYNELIRTNDITTYHKSLFNDLDNYNITYLNLPHIKLQHTQEATKSEIVYIQSIINAYIHTQKTINYNIKNSKWITDLLPAIKRTAHAN